MKCILACPRLHHLSTRQAFRPQVPLGHLVVATALRRAGHHVELWDFDARGTDARLAADQVRGSDPDLVFVGHPASTVAHAACLEAMGAFRRAAPRAKLVYGGVHPTYHHGSMPANCPETPDYILRHEAERTAVALALALEEGRDPCDVPGVVAPNGRSSSSAPVPPRDLDALAPDWSLVPRLTDYRAFGMPATVVQFSRGCPRSCGYCGQHAFWQSWRHRSAESFVEEVAVLARIGVRLLWIADENWSTRPGLFRELLAALARNPARPHLVVTMEGDHLIRDHEDLRLYREAGVSMVMIGYDATGHDCYGRLDKRNPQRELSEAVREAGRHGISVVINAFPDRRIGLRRAGSSLVSLGAQFYNMLFPTPHAWTEFARVAVEPVLENDLRRWDYRHPVIGASRGSMIARTAQVRLLEATLNLAGSVEFLASPRLRANPLARRSYAGALRVGAFETAELFTDLLSHVRRADIDVPSGDGLGSTDST